MTDGRKEKMTKMLTIGAAAIVNSYIPFVIDSLESLTVIAIVDILYLVIYRLHARWPNLARIILTIAPQVSTIGIGYFMFQGHMVEQGVKITILSTLIIPLFTIDLHERLLMIVCIGIVVLSYFSSNWIGITFLNPITNPPNGDDLEFAHLLVYLTAGLDMAILTSGFLYLRYLNSNAENKIIELMQKDIDRQKALASEREEAKEREVTSFKLMALKSQMNPHFIFNTISGIQYYVMKNERSLAYTYLSKFSHLMRMVLESNKKPVITLEEELQLISFYIELQMLRFPNCFTHSITVVPDLPVRTIRIPGMLIQPFIENAVHHGLVNKGSDGVLAINFRKEGSVLVCKIEDNGVGRHAAEVINKKKRQQHLPLATDITRERLALLMRIQDVKAKIDIIDLKDSDDNPIGTSVEICIPLETLYNDQSVKI